MNRRASTRRYTLLGLAAIVLWSTTVAFSRSVTEQLGPLTSAALIYTLGGILGGIYWLVSRTTPRLSSFDRRYLLGCGGLFALYTICFYLAVGMARNRAQALGVGLMNYLWPMLTLLFSLFLLRIRANVLFIPGVLAGMLGVFFVTTQGDSISWASFRQTMLHSATPLRPRLCGCGFLGPLFHAQPQVGWRCGERRSAAFHAGHGAGAGSRSRPGA